MKKIILALLVTCIAIPAFADITLVWDKAPLNIDLPVGKQRYVSFPEYVAFGLPSQLASSLHVENDNKTLYLTAERAFKTQQVKVRLQSGNMVLINLTGKKDASEEPVEVVFPHKKEKQSLGEDVGAKIKVEQLVQYAQQQLYAPKRLLKSVAGISLTSRFSGKSYDLISDGSAIAVPLYSWSGGGYVVTAVLLRNTLDIPLTIEPEMACGKWDFFSPFPLSRLMPRGNRNDTSTIFLVSRNDFDTNFSATCR